MEIAAAAPAKGRTDGHAIITTRKKHFNILLPHDFSRTKVSIFGDVSIINVSYDPE